MMTVWEKIRQISDELEKLQDKFRGHVKMTSKNGEMVPIFLESATPEIKEAYYEYVKIFDENEELLNIR